MPMSKLSSGIPEAHVGKHAIEAAIADELNGADQAWSCKVIAVAKVGDWIIQLGRADDRYERDLLVRPQQQNAEGIRAIIRGALGTTSRPM